MRLALIYSGEHDTLPKAETKGILEGELIEYRMIEDLPQALVIEAPEQAVSRLASRSAMLKAILEHIATVEAEPQHALRELSKTPLTIEAETFRVRVRRARESPPISTAELERKIGKLVKSQSPHSRVDLKSPQAEIQGFITSSKLIVGRLLASIKRGSFKARQQAMKAIYKPGSMNTITSRVLVNLSRARPGATLLDPFCGSGGILVEAALIGAKPIGSDIDFLTIEETRQNLALYGIEARVEVADARSLPYKHSIDAIATDPPYGRMAQAKAAQTPQELVEEFIEKAIEYLKPSCHLAISYSSNLSDTIRQAGFKLIEVHKQKVHKSLTRYIHVAKTPSNPTPHRQPKR